MVIIGVTNDVPRFSLCKGSLQRIKLRVEVADLKELLILIHDLDESCLEVVRRYFIGSICTPLKNPTAVSELRLQISGQFRGPRKEAGLVTSERRRAAQAPIVECETKEILSPGALWTQTHRLHYLDSNLGGLQCPHGYPWISTTTTRCTREHTTSVCSSRWYR